MPKKKSTAIVPVLAPDQLALQSSALDLLAQTQVTEANLGEIRETARLEKKRIDELRTAEKAPHLAAGREVDAKYKPTLDTLAKVVECCTDLLEQRLAAQRAEAQRLAQDTTIPMAERHAALVAVARPDIPSSTRIVVDFFYEIESFEDIPREWLMLDVERVLEFYKTTAGTGKIPGLKSVRKERLVTKSGGVKLPTEE